MFSRKWWRSTLERMAKTAAQAFIALVGTDWLGFKDLDWSWIGLVVVIMTVLSFASSILTTKMGPNDDDPSAV